MVRTGFRAGDRDRAKALFRALPRSVRGATSAALDREAGELAEAIRRAVPVDDGDLRDSVRVRRGRPAKTSKGEVAQEAGADADLSVRVVEGDTKTFYAPFVEFGHSDAPAKPHFFPTYRARKKAMARRIKAAQRRAIREAEKDV